MAAAVSWLMRFPSIRRPWLRGDLEMDAPEELDEDEASARKERRAFEPGIVGVIRVIIGSSVFRKA